MNHHYSTRRVLAMLIACGPDPRIRGAASLPLQRLKNIEHYRTRSETPSEFSRFRELVAATTFSRRTL